ncbi:HlyD family secretion protein [Flavihumibacter petaseus]|uniref:YbhG-like alpha-helical hairpin domain-containing protein n=1 Tax=Flavihumibacter petaseus NBRC 106054 TaxID=1220578 RepID=A0A0E9N194_9BACT|nr:efflux RND transporter periplasmic adaptor subunit [Flavihumibacter petaseus]GAO43513.1 hypothetical protein FPE01S_02_06180 [Flavihumibacter petaseus NBRC 106054]
MKWIRNYWALLIPLLVLIIALWVWTRSASKPAPETVIGMVEAESVDVAASFPGRLDSLLVREGDTIQKGQLLAVLHSSEISTVQQQALAAVDAARGQLTLLQQGARPQLIKSAENIYRIAQDQYELFDKTYARMQRLYNDEVVSGQEKDIVYFRYQAAQKEMETAKLNLEMLQQGANPALIQSAKAILRQAEEGYALTKNLKDNTRVYAPESGVVSQVVIKQGEVVAIGYPMMTIREHGGLYIQFNVRQDKAGSLQAGTIAPVSVPGAEPKNFNLKITEVSPSLEFANWVPVKEQGQFELRTFTIKGVPVVSVKGLRPGMTASLEISPERQ